jgi:hypothetical protein
VRERLRSLRVQVVLDGNFYKNFGDLFDDACWEKK